MARQMQISLSSLSVCGRMGDLAHLLKLRWVFLQEIPGLSALTFKRGLTKGSISQASPVPVFTKRTPQSLNFHPQAPQIPGSGESSSLKLEVEEWELCCDHHTPRVTHTFYMNDRALPLNVTHYYPGNECSELQVYRTYFGKCI